MNILITGGGSGLGESITRLLLKDGHTVLFTYLNAKAESEALVKEFPNAKALKVDFKNESDVKVLTEQMQQFNPDVLVNNALSSFTQTHFHKIDSTTFSESFLTNVLPVLKITSEAICLFRKKKSGRIITILSSAIVNTPPVGWSEYTANKAYLYSMCKSWATENAAFNITSNAISPSLMETKLSEGMDKRVVEMAAESHPLKALLTTKEVAEAVKFFVECSPHINGVNMVINAAANVI